MVNTDKKDEHSNDSMTGEKLQSIGIYNMGTIDVQDGGVINIYNSNGDKPTSDKNKIENNHFDNTSMSTTDDTV